MQSGNEAKPLSMILLFSLVPRPVLVTCSITALILQVTSAGLENEALTEVRALKKLLRV